MPQAFGAGRRGPGAGGEAMSSACTQDKSLRAGEATTITLGGRARPAIAKIRSPLRERS